MARYDIDTRQPTRGKSSWSILLRTTAKDGNLVETIVSETCDRGAAARFLAPARDPVEPARATLTLDGMTCLHE